MLAEIDYTNWRGVRSKRLILPLRLSEVQNEYHPIRCAAIVAFCLEKREVREFSISHIHSWLDVPGDMNGAFDAR